MCGWVSGVCVWRLWYLFFFFFLKENTKENVIIAKKKREGYKILSTKLT